MQVIMAASVLAAGVQQAPASLPATYCAELTALVRSAGESPPFASMADRPPGPMLGFDTPCAVSGRDRSGWFYCRQRSADFSAAALDAETARCLPAARRSTSPSDPESFEYRLGAILISIDGFAPTTADGNRARRISVEIRVNP